jgi:hypothetical protein
MDMVASDSKSSAPHSSDRVSLSAADGSESRAGAVPGPGWHYLVPTRVSLTLTRSPDRRGGLPAGTTVDGRERKPRDSH